MFGTEKLRQLVNLVFDYKKMQCPRCFYSGDETSDLTVNFPVGTNYDENNSYSENELSICPSCKKIF